MKILSKKTACLAAIVSMGLVGIASAHVGAPGHSHGEDWPFEVILGAIAVAVGAAAVVYSLVSKKVGSGRTKQEKPHSHRR